ncbi:MAG: PadR family transcriptional regulator [Verrucomicrobia bacterium]|nr:PadR family transcriptional regulator [Verrucomicrobiota bacterium]
MKISKDLNAASASAIVLGILQTGESYGYAIVQKVRELSGGEVEWTDGMLYPILHRLQADGLIAARWAQSETGRKRKYYQLTAEAHPVMNDDRRQWRTVQAILDRLWAMEISPSSAAQASTVSVPAV